MPDLAELVKARRSARNWSLRQLGTQIGVTPAYVADIEAARRLPSSELKERLATVLEIPIEELEAQIPGSHPICGSGLRSVRN